MEQRPCGLIGGSLGHSFSPQLHGMLGDYPYRLWPLTAEELPGVSGSETICRSQCHHSL